MISAITGSFLIWIYCNMTKLSTNASVARCDLSVYNDTAAYAGSECDYYNVPAALACAREDLAERRRVSVVFNVDLLAEACADERTQVGVAESEVAGIQNHARIAGSGAGGSDTDGVQLVDSYLRVVKSLPDGLCDRIRDLLRRTREVGLAGCLGYDIVIFIDQTDFDVSSAEVDTYIVLH